MFLRCPCGNLFRLAKYQMPPWYSYPDPTSDRLDMWFQEHADCDPDGYPARPTVVFESDGALHAEGASLD